jgi:hypothetical protein
VKYTSKSGAGELLPKIKGMPAEMGGSGESLPEENNGDH